MRCVSTPPRYRGDFRPLVEGYGGYCCTNHQRAYLQHLLVTNELLAGVLLMLHNTAQYTTFFRALRAALASDQLELFKTRVLRSKRVVKNDQEGDDQRATVGLSEEDS